MIWLHFFIGHLVYLIHEHQNTSTMKTHVQKRLDCIFKFYSSYHTQHSMKFRLEFYEGYDTNVGMVLNLRWGSNVECDKFVEHFSHVGSLVWDEAK